MKRKPGIPENERYQEEIKRLSRLLEKCQVCDKEKSERILYLEHIIIYLESKQKEGKK